jgi:energy-coupling factor transporter ATP-binding protein EcfA2
MSQKIRTIKLKCLRGATGETIIELDPNKPMTVMFGENGTGKSTIIDALDLVCNENIGSLSDRSIGGIRIQYLHSVGQQQSELSVEVTTDQGTWTGAVQSNRIVVTNAPGRPQVHILRRARILKLVEATPSERYGELRHFIDVTKVESAENRLSSAIREVEGRNRDYVVRKSEAYMALRRLWEAEGRPGSATEREWAAEMAAADADALNRTWEEANTLHSFIIRAIDLTEQRMRLQAELAEKRRYRDLCKDETDQAEQLDRKATPRLSTILSEVLAFISPPHEPDLCPVCEQPIVAQDLRCRLVAKIASMKDMGTLASRLETANRAVVTAESALTHLEQALMSVVNNVLDKLRASSMASVASLSLDWSKFSPLLQSQADPDTRLLPLAEEVIRHTRCIVDSIREEGDAALAHANKLNAIRGYYQSIIETETNDTEATRTLARLNRMLEIVRGSRHEYVDNILDAVEDNCNRLYERLHPGETLGKLKLEMDPEQRGSLLQNAKFGDHDGIPPQAYFSESHLDTLGFCLFMAVAKHQSGEDAIIVLDDVFTSVDAGHLTRVIKLLEEECSHCRQIIVATHYRDWLERYRISGGPGNKVHLLHLRRWSYSAGVRSDKMKLAVDDLRNAIMRDPFERREVANQAGILLEALLDGLAMSYRCGVPRSPTNAYTLGELLDATTRASRLVKTLRHMVPVNDNGPIPASGTEIQIEPLIVSIRQFAFIRNQVGCHFNLQGNLISENDIKRFGECVVELADAFTCTECGGIPDRQAGTHFRCACRHIVMTPLRLS